MINKIYKIIYSYRWQAFIFFLTYVIVEAIERTFGASSIVKVINFGIYGTVFIFLAKIHVFCCGIPLLASFIHRKWHNCNHKHHEDSCCAHEYNKEK